MSIEKITGYETEDGKIFRSSKDAIEHQFRQGINCLMSDIGVTPIDAYTEDIRNRLNDFKDVFNAIDYDAVAESD